jgi:hypothetical protein
MTQSLTIKLLAIRSVSLQFSTSVKLVKWSDHDVTHKVLSLWFLCGLAITLVLAFLSFFSDVTVTIKVEATWLSIYLFSMMSICGSGFWLTYRNKNVTHTSTVGVLSKLSSVTIGVLGAAILFASSILSGLPILFHHTSSHEGSIVLTVIDKKLRGSRYQCSPALIVGEFTWFNSNRICIDKHTYNKFSVGEELIVKGFISPFGIEAELVSKTNH